jgi:hypothetical protein
MSITSSIKPPRDKPNNGRWAFFEKMDPDNYVGFIYLIQDPFLREYYIGKKTYRTKKGEENNWKTYISSSKYLKIMFLERPLSEFQFICLEQYKTKGTLSYAETWSLCHVNAPLSKHCVNMRIEGISWKIQEPISKRHLERLHAYTCF